MPVLGNCQSYEKVFLVEVKMNEVGGKEWNGEFRSKFIYVAILENFLYETFFSWFIKLMLGTGGPQVGTVFK